VSVSRQTEQPLPDYRLSASNKTARDVARNMVPEADMARAARIAGGR